MFSLKYVLLKYALASDAVAALTAVYGTVYDIGSSANLLCTLK